MDGLPLISFVIPTYNEEKRLGNCLDSILAQDYPKEKIEIIVVDGMSKDGTVKIAKKYGVKVINNPKRIVGNALKIAVDAARANIIAPIPADCILVQKDWIKRMIRAFDYPSVAGVVCLITPNKYHTPISRFFALIQADPIIAIAHGTGETATEEFITEANYFPTQGFLLRKDMVLEVGNYNPDLVRSEDVDLTMRLLKKGYCLYLMKDAGVYHVFVENFGAFVKKFYQRILAFTYSYGKLNYSYLPKRSVRSKFLINLFLNTAVVGSLLAVQKNMKKKTDIAWFYYPVVTLTSVMIYSIVLLTRPNGRKAIRNMVGST